MLELIEDRHDVLVDMAEVGYIDSSGVASLIEAYQTAKSINTRFGLVSVSGTPLRVLEVAKLERIFPIYESVADGAADRKRT